MFTEEEKDEMIADVIKDKIDGDGGVCLKDCFCCDTIFPRVRNTFDCPCHVYTKKYVKYKFWKAME